MDRDRLIAALDEKLEIGAYRDYAPNGLQVAGGEVVRSIMTAVTASQRAIDAAVARGVDLLLVHHGYFWKGEDSRVIGMKQQRLRALLTAEINLVAYHLPLDGHPELGNNAQWGAQLGVHIEGQLESAALVSYGNLTESLSLAQLGKKVAAPLDGRKPLLIQGHDRPIRKIGWCSGGAQDYIEQAAAAGLDAYLSGEVSERTYHQAMELGINYLACGHHATERAGVIALGHWIEQQFEIPCHFFDEPNPV